jgi:hypothetical protein
MRTLKICRSQTLRTYEHSSIDVDESIDIMCYFLWNFLELPVPQGAKNLSEIQEYVRWVIHRNIDARTCWICCLGRWTSSIINVFSINCRINSSHDKHRHWTRRTQCRLWFLLRHIYWTVLCHVYRLFSFDCCMISNFCFFDQETIVYWYKHSMCPYRCGTLLVVYDLCMSTCLFNPHRWARLMKNISYETRQ